MRFSAVWIAIPNMAQLANGLLAAGRPIRRARGPEHRIVLEAPGQVGGEGFRGSVGLAGVALHQIGAVAPRSELQADVEEVDELASGEAHPAAAGIVGRIIKLQHAALLSTRLSAFYICSSMITDAIPEGFPQLVANPASSGFHGAG
jgi:hypothetical protein